MFKNLRVTLRESNTAYFISMYAVTNDTEVHWWDRNAITISLIHDVEFYEQRVAIAIERKFNDRVEISADNIDKYFDNFEIHGVFIDDEKAKRFVKHRPDLELMHVYTY